LILTPPTTFEDLITQAKDLTQGDIQGFAYNLNEPFWGAGFYGAFGGWPLDENDRPQFENQAFIDYLTFVKKLKDDGVVPPECDYNCADTLMKDGKAAMIINGDWSLGDYTTALGENLGVGPVPPINGQPYTEMTAGKYFMVSNAVLDDAAKKDAVVKFITFMTSADVQKKWLDEFKRLPSNTEVAKDPSIVSDPILAGSMADLSVGRGQPAAPEMRCAWDAWRPNLEGVMAGTLSPEDAAVAAQTAADECVATLE
jgi:arabinogalactan oligomer / maltooligosaccharide transport system substrate-binding protein